MDRRVRRSRRALRDAFLALVLERGYERIGVDDIAERADVARATFYAHHPDKQALLDAVFTEISDQLVSELTQLEEAPTQIRTDLVERLYREAASLRDVYLVVLRGAGDGRARQRYLETIAAAAETVFGQRLEAAGATARVPMRAVALTFAAAHVALLHEWLETDDAVRLPVHEAAILELQLLTHGLGWALDIAPEFMTNL